MCKLWISLISLVVLLGSAMPAQQPELGSAPLPVRSPDYVLGPGDQITIWAVDLDEVSQKPFRIDASGMVTVPLAGRVKASGLTVAELEGTVVGRLKTYQHNPQVTVNVTEYRSQPVSVIGAVNSPGVHHLQGSNTLIETLSLAGGLRPDAGYSIKVTRLREVGSIPLAGAKEDASGRFSIAEVGVGELTQANSPEKNIIIMSQDVISVPRAEMVYLMGEVAKPGAYTLGEHREMSVLQALSLAGGFTRMAAGKNAKILRMEPGNEKRSEQVLDLRRVLTGKSRDVVLHAEDILYVPDNKPKSVALRVVEAAVNAGTGIVVFRTGR